MQEYKKVNLYSYFLISFSIFGLFLVFYFVWDIGYYMVGDPSTDPSVLFGILINEEVIGLVLVLFIIAVLFSFTLGFVILYPLLKFSVSGYSYMEVSLKRFNLGVGYEAVYYILSSTLLNSSLRWLLSPIYEPRFIPSNVVSTSVSLWILFGLMLGYFLSRVVVLITYLIAHRRGKISALKNEKANRVILVRNSHRIQFVSNVT